MAETKITVEHGYFSDKDAVVREIEEQSLIYSPEATFSPSEGTPIHWHATGLHVYITGGKFCFRDPATDERHECETGCKFVIPEQELHIEEKHNGYSCIVGLTKEFSEPFVRSPEELEQLAESV